MDIMSVGVLNLGVYWTYMCRSCTDVELKGFSSRLIYADMWVYAYML